MDNPFKELKVKAIKPRDEIWDQKEIEKLINASDDLGYSGIKTAIILAYRTSQRQTDIINLKWEDYDGRYLTILQSKTESDSKISIKVRIPVFKLLPLKIYLDSLEKKCDYIVCYFDKNKKEVKNYKRDLFVHRFIEVKRKIGSDKLFRDFRRTAITKLAEAGCTVPEIASFSGHSHKSVQKMLDTYISKNSKVSDKAGAKLMKNSCKKYR